MALALTTPIFNKKVHPTQAVECLKWIFILTFIFRSGNRAGERYMGVGEHEDEEFDQPEMDSFTIEF